MSEHYDFIIVGSGAGGSAAAHRLAATGKRILILEKGQPLPGDGSTLDVGTVFREGRFKSREPWLDGKGRTVMPEEYFNVGGKTKWYGAALLRFQPNEFEADPQHRCLGWPIAYDDVAPYYDRAERLLMVRHFAIEPELRAILDHVERQDPDWREQPLPLGLDPLILNHPEEARHFDGFASAKDLKSDAEARFLDALAAANHVDLVTGAAVTALEPARDDPRRVAGVRCADGARYEGDTVLLAAGALHSPRLLESYLRTTGLASASASFPNVGQNYKCHLNSAVLAISRSRKTDLLRKTVLLLHPAFPHSSVQTLGWMDGEIVGAQLPGWLPSAVADAVGSRAYGFWLCTEDGSSPDNRIRAANGAGFPILDYNPGRLPEAVDEHLRLWRTLRRQLLAAGFVAFTKPIPLEGTAHACGTLVAGADPAQSVVGADGRAHDLVNLYVVDGSALPRSSRVNPALTIYAWSLRVADRLADGTEDGNA
jgi:choline dehydrogenase-like flavoprotein